MATPTGSVTACATELREGTATDPDPITACSFTPRKITVTSTTPGSRWANEWFAFTDTNGNNTGRAWLEEYVDGAYQGGWSVEVPASNRVPYFWDDALAGIVDEIRYFSVDADGNKTGDALCSLTVRYQITGTRHSS